MAERIIRQLIDDLDGSHIPDGGGESLEFEVRGVRYRIDLCAENAAKFDAAVNPFVAAAAPVGASAGMRKKTTGQRSPSNRPSPATVGTLTNAGPPASAGSPPPTAGPPNIGDNASSEAGSSERIREIRDWARRNGVKVSKRGRIKAEVIAAFAAAH